VNVHQLLSGAGPHDAITAEAIAFRSHFRRWGWEGHDYAARIAPGVDGSINSWARLSPESGDILLIHHSAGTPRLRELLALPNPKLLLYHNVTPPSWLWAQAPLVAAQCAIGHEQLPELIRAAHVIAADSEFNAAALRALGARETTMIPLLIDLDRLGPRQRRPTPRAPTVLFVGRLSPHKRQDEVIRCFALYRRHHAPDARLVIVGDPITRHYAEFLRRLGDELAPGAVQIETGLSSGELGDRYRSADAFLCLSEHEGFCIPLLEAFHFGVPVIARPEGAVPETAGDAALLVEDGDRAVVAELLHLAITDEALRAELRRRAADRLRVFSPSAVAARLRRAVEDTFTRSRASLQPAPRDAVAVR
jgi:glycosyltransferase involved in cell wall biosynthesis